GVPPTPAIAADRHRHFPGADQADGWPNGTTSSAEVAGQFRPEAGELTSLAREPGAEYRGVVTPLTRTLGRGLRCCSGVGQDDGLDDVVSAPGALPRREGQRSAYRLGQVVPGAESARERDRVQTRISRDGRTACNHRQGIAQHV